MSFAALAGKQQPGDDTPSSFLSRLDAWNSMDNIVMDEDIKADEQLLNKLGQMVCDEFDIDKASRAEWEQLHEQAHELVKMLKGNKTLPWPGASDVKYPLALQACIQFQARTFSAYFGNGAGNIAKGKAIGRDEDGSKADRADRIGQHMSYQLTEQDDTWLEDTDKLFLTLPLIGTGFRKTYRDIVDNVNVSETCDAWDVVVNNRAKSMERAARITHVIYLYPHEIEERIRASIFVPFKYDQTGELVEARAGDDGGTVQVNDPMNPHEFLEQHRWYDLDGDGYPEPYIMTVHKETRTVVRIVARWDVDGITTDPKMGDVLRIKPVNYFTRYVFMHSLTGSIYGLGFGALLAAPNAAINSAINQLFDAGTLQNFGMGVYKKGIKVGDDRGDGIVSVMPGEYVPVDMGGNNTQSIRDVFHKLDTPEPSMALFNLLGFMVEAGNNLASVSDMMAGKTRGANESPTTTSLLLEQGLQVFGTILIRIYIAMKKEFKKLYRLNRLYLTDKEYFTVLDIDGVIAQADYEQKDCDVVPVVDPNELTNHIKQLRAEALMQLLGTGFNDFEIRKHYLETMRLPDIERFLPKEDQAEQIPPEVQIEQAKLELEQQKLELEVQKLALEERKVAADEMKAMADARLKRAQAVKAIADAESAENGEDIEYYKRMLDEANTVIQQIEGNNQTQEKAA